MCFLLIVNTNTRLAKMKMHQILGSRANTMEQITQTVLLEFMSKQYTARKTFENVTLAYEDIICM